MFADPLAVTRIDTRVSDLHERAVAEELAKNEVEYQLVRELIRVRGGTKR